MRGAGFTAAVMLALAGCTPVPVDPGSHPRPSARPVPQSQADAEAAAISAETAAYYRQIEQNMVARGQMRTDGGGPDTPYTVEDLTEAFLQVALYKEYSERNGRMVSGATPSHLQRWDRPVRIRVVAGNAVSPERSARDRANIQSFAARLSRLTRHPISVTSGPGNFTVLILGEVERRNYGAELAQLIPGLSPASTQAILDMAPTNYCHVAAVTDDTTNTYIQAVAVIRAEHPNLLRLSCIHEELAQGLGLPNDSPKARPSIFNDDEEFGLLTTMDEKMLRILYDPRMRPGMSEAEARPIVHQIAQELMGGPS